MLDQGFDPIQAQEYIDSLKQAAKEESTGFDFGRFVSKPKKAK